MGIDIRVGDCIKEMRKMDADSVDCVVTSPPYWGLRDYGVDGQLGLEASLAEHLAVMVEVFEEVRRVLKPEGTLWLNYGDCYAASVNGRSAADTKAAGGDDRTFRDKPFSTVQGSLKPKDLCMVPNRIAIALQDAGWWVRSEIVWAKPNPMPESVMDRPATSHEKIWLLTKSARYWFDAEAVKQPVSPNTNARVSQDLANQEGSHRANGGRKSNGPMRAVVAGSSRKLANEGQRMVGQKASREAALSLGVESRNVRNYEPAPPNDAADFEVWPLATQAFKGAHFATFPIALAERCIKAGCPEHGLVLDPFGGSGTTGIAADRLRRNAVLIELNLDYARLARRRCDELSLFSGVDWAPQEAHAE